MATLQSIPTTDHLLRLHLWQLCTSPIVGAGIHVDREALAKLAPGWEDGRGVDAVPLQELLDCLLVEERFISMPLYAHTEGPPGYPIPMHFFYFGDGPDNVEGAAGEPGNAPLLFTQCELSPCEGWVALYAAGSVRVYRADGTPADIHDVWNSYDRGSVRVVFLPSGLVALEAYDENNGHSLKLHQPEGGTMRPALISALEQMAELDAAHLPWSLEHLDHGMLDSRDAVLRTLRQGMVDGLGRVSARLKDDREVAQAAIASHAGNYVHVSPALQHDRDLAMQAAGRDAEVVRRFPADMLADRAFLEELLAAVPTAIHGLPPEMREGALVEFVAHAHPEAYAYDVSAAPPGFFSDRANVLRVVGVRGRAIEHLDSAVLNDDEVMLAALRNDPSSAALLHEKGLVTRARVMQWVAELPGVLTWLPEWADDAAIGLHAVNTNGEALEHLSERLRNSREMVLAACARNSGALRYAGEELLRADAELRAMQERISAEEDELPF